MNFLIPYLCTFAIYYYLFQASYMITGDNSWVAKFVLSLLLSLFLWFGTFAVIAAIVRVKSEFLPAKSALKGERPRDGIFAAFFGEVELCGAPLIAPFSRKSYIAYEYKIEH
jgi:hypothetical protein